MLALPLCRIYRLPIVFFLPMGWENSFTWTLHMNLNSVLTLTKKLQTIYHSVESSSLLLVTIALYFCFICEYFCKAVTSSQKVCFLILFRLSLGPDKITILDHEGNKFFSTRKICCLVGAPLTFNQIRQMAVTSNNQDTNTKESLISRFNSYQSVCQAWDNTHPGVYFWILVLFTWSSFTPTNNKKQQSKIELGKRRNEILIDAEQFILGEFLWRSHLFTTRFFAGYVVTRKPTGDPQLDHEKEIDYGWKLFNKMYNYCISTGTLQLFVVTFSNPDLVGWMHPHPYNDSIWTKLKCKHCSWATSTAEVKDRVFTYVIYHALEISKDANHPKVSPTTLSLLFSVFDQLSHVLQVSRFLPSIFS